MNAFVFQWHSLVMLSVKAELEDGEHISHDILELRNIKRRVILGNSS